jgi:protein-ribulosamine 3-kinase
VSVARALAALGAPGARVTPVSGGDIHRAFRVELPGGPAFLKVNARPTPGMFAAEAEGLDALRGTSLGVPAVLGVGEGWLALSWIERGRGGGAALGEGLAALHRRTAPAFGFGRDNWIGALPQANGWIEDLPTFFATRRLLPQAAGPGVPAAVRRGVERLCERLPELLPDEPPALLHGDLWGGNWMADVDGAPWIFDPAVHFGGREAELAFTRLFGGFPPEFHAAYHATWPLSPGFEERVDLWNLYPLLVHANLFGGGYAGSAGRIVGRFV